MSNEPYVHIYAQHWEHSPATIRGNREGLLELKRAIEVALEKGGGKANLFTSDGEGYGVYVERVNLISSLGKLPYVQDLIWESVKFEQNLMKKYHKREDD